MSSAQTAQRQKRRRDVLLRSSDWRHRSGWRCSPHKCKRRRRRRLSLDWHLDDGRNRSRDLQEGEKNKSRHVLTSCHSCMPEKNARLYPCKVVVIQLVGSNFFAHPIATQNALSDLSSFFTCRLEDGSSRTLLVLDDVGATRGGF